MAPLLEPVSLMEQIEWLFDIRTHLSTQSEEDLNNALANSRVYSDSEAAEHNTRILFEQFVHGHTSGLTTKTIKEIYEICSKLQQFLKEMPNSEYLEPFKSFVTQTIERLETIDKAYQHSVPKTLLWLGAGPYTQDDTADSDDSLPLIVSQYFATQKKIFVNQERRRAIDDTIESQSQDALNLAWLCGQEGYNPEEYRFRERSA